MFRLLYRVGVVQRLSSSCAFGRVSKSISVVPNTHPLGEFCVRGLRRDAKREVSAESLPSKGERELLEFVTEEIIRERKAQVHQNPHNIINGFQLVMDGADVQLTKECEKEKINISFNINHTVVTESEESLPFEKSDLCLLRSKPTFEVNIVRGNIILSFVCSFLQGTLEEKEKAEVFRVDEISIFQNSWNDRVYAVEGQLIDSYLYELLINMLYEKGITQEFGLKISELATAHEHSSYISFLENLSKFTFPNVE